MLRCHLQACPPNVARLQSRKRSQLPAQRLRRASDPQHSPPLWYPTLLKARPCPSCTLA
jgi:hypothetical protein